MQLQIYIFSALDFDFQKHFFGKKSNNDYLYTFKIRTLVDQWIINAFLLGSIDFKQN